MYRTLSSIDFSLFIGQIVVEVNTDKNIAFGMTFESSYLTIECPWRICASNEVLLGYSDIIHSNGKFTHKNAEKLLLGKKIVNIFHFEEIADLMIDGCNMGIKSICGYMNQYSGASKSSMQVAEDLVKTEEKFRDELKAFL